MMEAVRGTCEWNGTSNRITCFLHQSFLQNRRKIQRNGTRQKRAYARLFAVSFREGLFLRALKKWHGIEAFLRFRSLLRGAKDEERNMSKKLKLAFVAAMASAAVVLSGCRSAEFAPVPARPIAVQPVALPVASASGATAMPIPLASAPAATSVAGVEVQTAPIAGAEPRTKAVLIVQNHTGLEEMPFALSTLGDWLQTALGTVNFTVVNPHDAIGTEQNVGSWDEQMPESSATHLAESLDAPVLLTASVTSARVRKIGGTAPGAQAVLEFTLSAKVVPSGEGIAAVTAAARSKKDESLEALQQKGANTWAELAKEAAFSASRALQAEYAKAGGVAAVPAAKMARVAFSANVAGANIRIDGVSYGTLGNEPRAITVSKGLHNLEIAYPRFKVFKDLVRIQEDTTFAVTLALTSEGESARKKDALFAATMDRMEKSGATDDLVREVVAKGYAQYLSASHVQLHGMPQELALPEFVPSAEVDVSSIEPDGGPSTEKFTDRARELAE